MAGIGIAPEANIGHLLSASKTSQAPRHSPIGIDAGCIVRILITAINALHEISCIGCQPYCQSN